MKDLELLAAWFLHALGTARAERLGKFTALAWVCRDGHHETDRHVTSSPCVQIAWGVSLFCDCQATGPNSRRRAPRHACVAPIPRGPRQRERRWRAGPGQSPAVASAYFPERPTVPQRWRGLRRRKHPETDL